MTRAGTPPLESGIGGRDRELGLIGGRGARRDRSVTVRNEFQFSAAPHGSAVQELQPACQDRVRRLLAVEDRRNRDPHRLAIGLQGPIAARAKQCRCVDRGRVEAAAVLGVRQKVIDDLRRVSVGAVYAGAKEDSEDLGVVVADRSGVAEVVARPPEISCALVSERVVRVESGQIGPRCLRRRPVAPSEAQFKRATDGLICKSSRYCLSAPRITP